MSYARGGLVTGVAYPRQVDLFPDPLGHDDLRGWKRLGFRALLEEGLVTYLERAPIIPPAVRKDLKRMACLQDPFSPGRRDSYCRDACALLLVPPRLTLGDLAERFKRDAWVGMSPTARRWLKGNPVADELFPAWTLFQIRLSPIIRLAGRSPEEQARQMGRFGFSHPPLLVSYLLAVLAKRRLPGAASHLRCFCSASIAPGSEFVQVFLSDELGYCVDDEPSGQEAAAVACRQVPGYP